jgi:cytosine deaminase
MLGLEHGVLHLRAFVNTDTRAKLEGMKALPRFKREFKDTLNLQVVAFLQDGVLRDPACECT